MWNGRRRYKEGGRERDLRIHGRVDCPENDMGIDRCLCRTSSGQCWENMGPGHIHSFIHRHWWAAGNKEIDLKEEIKARQAIC